LLRLAVQRFVATWLQLQHADAAVAKASTESLQQVKFWSLRQDQASRRYERALKTLTLLSKRGSSQQFDETGSDENKLDPKGALLQVAGRA
jgi:hypothetical protein